MHVRLRKFNLAYWRSPSYNFVRLLVTLLVSLLYGTTYYQRGQVSSPATLGNIQNVVRPRLFKSSYLLALGFRVP